MEYQDHGHREHDLDRGQGQNARLWQDFRQRSANRQDA
jgi:hypothetical protein